MRKKGRRHKSPISGTRGDIMTDSTDIKKEYYEQIYASKSDTLDETHKFLEITKAHASRNTS